MPWIALQWAAAGLQALCTMMQLFLNVRLRLSMHTAVYWLLIAQIPWGGFTMLLKQTSTVQQHPPVGPSMADTGTSCCLSVRLPATQLTAPGFELLTLTLLLVLLLIILLIDAGLSAVAAAEVL